MSCHTWNSTSPVHLRGWVYIMLYWLGHHERIISKAPYLRVLCQETTALTQALGSLPTLQIWWKVDKIDSVDCEDRKREMDINICKYCDAECNHLLNINIKPTYRLNESRPVVFSMHFEIYINLPFTTVYVPVLLQDQWYGGENYKWMFHSLYIWNKNSYRTLTRPQSFE